MTQSNLYENTIAFGLMSKEDQTAIEKAYPDVLMYKGSQSDGSPVFSGPIGEKPLVYRTYRLKKPAEKRAPWDRLPPEVTHVCFGRHYPYSAIMFSQKPVFNGTDWLGPVGSYSYIGEIHMRHFHPDEWDLGDKAIDSLLERPKPKEKTFPWHEVSEDVEYVCFDCNSPQYIHLFMSAPHTDDGMREWTGIGYVGCACAHKLEGHVYLGDDWKESLLKRPEATKKKFPWQQVADDVTHVCFDMRTPEVVQMFMGKPVMGSSEWMEGLDAAYKGHILLHKLVGEVDLGDDWEQSLLERPAEDR